MIKSLFISYNGALEPLMQSQAIPYLKGLSEKGVGSFLLTFEKTKDKERIRNLKRELESYNIEWHAFRYHKRPSVPATLLDIFIGIVAGLCLVISKKIDIIHARATVPAAMAYVIAKITRKKFIFDVRGLMAEEYADGGIWRRESLRHKCTLYFQKLFLKSADELVVITENIKNFLYESDYLDKKNKKISVVSCCVDTGRFRKASSRNEALRQKFGLMGKFVFLYIGSVGTWYMLREMMDFFIATKSVISNSHFLILTHVDKDMAKRVRDEKGLSSKDITIDEAGFNDMPEYINLADVGIFFIKPVFSKRSSCPTKFAEYLSCGLPLVINSKIGDTDNIVKERKLGVVIDDFDKDSYLSGLRELSVLMKEKELLTKRSRMTAEELFSLEKGVSVYFDIYRRLGCN